MSAAKIIAKPLAKRVAKTTRGRQRKQRGTSAATPEQKAAARKAVKAGDVQNLREFKKLSPKEQAKYMPQTGGAKAVSTKPKEKYTKGQRKEIEKISGVSLSKLKGMSPSEQQAYLKGKSDLPESIPLPSRRATGPDKGSVAGQKVEQGPLLSKVQLPDKMSKKQARRLLMTGQAKIVTGKGGKKKLVTTGEYAPAKEVIAEDILGSPGVLPSGKELDDLISSGFEVRKGGGKIYRRAGGAIRGWGAATRGY